MATELHGENLARVSGSKTHQATRNDDTGIAWATAAVLVVLILAVAAYNIAEFKFFKVAVEHGCALADNRITCAHGDRQ